MDIDPFIPTPAFLIDAKIELAELRPGEVVYDLGCGDGSVLIKAAENQAIRAVGIEIRPELVESARAAVREHQLEDRIEIRQQDFHSLDLTEADVLIIYLTRLSLGQISLKLEQELKPGARIVTHQFDLPAWTAEREVKITLPNGSEEPLFRYVQGARA